MRHDIAVILRSGQDATARIRQQRANTSIADGCDTLFLGVAADSHYSLHINCGGNEAIFNNSKYEVDLEVRGASMFYSGQNWAFSSTGNFMDNDLEAVVYIDANTSTLHNVSAIDSELTLKTLSWKDGKNNQ
ncbi:putative LRR receptor-like serine/threonine-protein kinase [Camellia lanceoleosa]|uniref:LRR receptor-like serine/threonine-protein kinase n=1 Tax=Camellia lanceoleosa TaxID=1840588 RepID=A0ACC0FRD4_9ERIC|nr:putative LRR receptor-like serine/threonine-protein kinase [Camellia lanceoleosa]